jgi:dCTP deaminase
MSATAPTLLPLADDGAPEVDFTTGIVPSQGLRALINREIQAALPVAEDQIQPASLDLRLGEVAYRVRASFLPGPNATVMEKLDDLSMHRIDLTDGAVLERGCVYIIPLIEHLALRKRTSAIANPKSSTGRLDIFARLITDHGSEFDRVRERYQGPLYAEVSPRTFSILVRAGTRLVQLRVRRGSPRSSDTALRELQEQHQLVGPDSGQAVVRDGGVAFTVDLAGDPGTGIIGYKARHHAGLIDVEKIAHYDPLDFWEPIAAGRQRALVLNPDDFYILASKEAVVVPPDHAAEMLAYDTLVGEFRVHYAGFFDPGFGHSETGGSGTRAVLEVRSHEVPFLIEDGQMVGRLIYERLTGRPDKLYGVGIGSSYQRQFLALSKQFKPIAQRPT